MKYWHKMNDRSLIVYLYIFQIGAQTSVFTVESGSPSRSSRHKPSILSLTSGGPYLSSTWWTSKETIGTWGGNNFAVQGILEHLNVTKDISDYLWYTTRWVLSTCCWRIYDFVRSDSVVNHLLLFFLYSVHD